MRGEATCRHCGEPIYFSGGEGWFHCPPYKWGSDQWHITRPIKMPNGEDNPYFTETIQNPEWHNGMGCDKDWTTRAEPTDKDEERMDREYAKLIEKRTDPFFWMGGRWTQP